MPWVPLVSDEQASPEVRKMYAFLKENWTFVPNYFLALGRDPQLLQDQINLYTNAMFSDRPGGLSRLQKEQVALVVSGLNVSSYCLAAHMQILGQLGMDKDTKRKLAMDYASAPVEPKFLLLLKLVEKLTRQPGDMEQADVDRVRAGGWKDGEIFDAVLVTALYACANRFSAGLGLLPDF